MFDWNDEELTNIIWGEAVEGEDHIVPYPDGSQEKPPDIYSDHIKKEQNQEAIDVKPSEQNKSISQSDAHRVKLEGSSRNVTNEGLGTTEVSLDSWPNLSLPGTAKAEQDMLGTEVNDVTEIGKHESKNEDQAATHDNASEIFQSPIDESEQSDFVDYRWATVGSFEDLDRIFSDDDPIFGHSSLGNSDELWSSSKNVTSSPEKSLPLSLDSPSLGTGGLKSTSEQLEVKADYPSDEKSLGPGYKKLNLFTSSTSEDSTSCIENIQFAGGKSKLSMKQKTASEMVGNSPVFDLPADARSIPATKIEKGNRQKKLLKGRTKEGQSEIRHLQDLHGSWNHTRNQFIQYDSQFVPAVCQPGSSIVFGHQLQFQAPESSPYRNFPGPIAPLIRGNMAKQYATLPVLTQFPSGEGSRQPVPSSYQVSPRNLGNLNKSAQAPNSSLAMTPQEKIEKLRRRQQMRAMLAIQKQQQQFGNQILTTEYSGMEGENTEAEEMLSTLPSLDPNSPTEQDDSNTFSTGPDDCPIQDSILYHLQDIIGKLDIRIRLCIRDSLVRLAQSARQRQYAGDVSSSKCSKDEVLKKDEISSHKRFSKAPAIETQTNPLDRTVAHLLFHRPHELSGKSVDALDSPSSAKILPFERKATGSTSLPSTLLPQRPENKRSLSHDESKVASIFTAGDGVQKNTPRLNASENATTNRGSVDGIPKIDTPSGGQSLKCL